MLGTTATELLFLGNARSVSYPMLHQSLLEKQKYRIEGMFAVQIEKYFKGKKLCEREVGQVPLRSVYKQIKHVYDHNGVLIARRNSPSGPLKVTGRGMSKFLDYDKKS